MSGVFDESPVLQGGTDNTSIGNFLDRLKVDASINGNSLTNNNYLYSVALSINMASSSTNNPLILFRNPSGSGKVVRIKRISCGVNINNVFASFYVFHTPTVTTNGTSQTPVSTNIGGGASAAVSLVTTLPTVSSTGTALANGAVGQNSASITLTDNFDIYIQANQAILITGAPSSNNREAVITVVWGEV